MLNKTYNPQEIETHWYEASEASGAFACDPTSDKAPYTIMMPPPNVTGSLHMGHALTFTLQDILIRFHKKLNKNVLWQQTYLNLGILLEYFYLNLLFYLKYLQILNHVFFLFQNH